MKNLNLTQLDTDQIIKATFQQDDDAQRVILVGGEKIELSIDSDKIAQAVKEGLSNIDFKDVSKNEPKLELLPQIQSIKEHIFIPQVEIKEIEKQVIVPQIEYRTIEIPVITEKVVTIEKPIVIKEIEIKEVVKERFYPFVMKASAVIQAIAAVVLIIILLKK